MNDRAVPSATTLHIRDTCLHLQRAARAMARRFDAALRPLDLINGQFSLLMALNRSEPVVLAGVADLPGIDRTTLTASLKPLVRRDLVAVLVDEKDRRGRRLALTDDGLALLAQAVPAWAATHAALPEGAREDAGRDWLAALQD